MSRINNFDIIRFLAALQVVVVHGYEHLGLEEPHLEPFIKVISYFPGVPIFFTISGFLIYASFKKNGNLKRYFRNRFLRIFPNLWLCLIVTVAVLGLYGFITNQTVRDDSFYFWLFGQITFLQFYTPEILRGFGVGTPNGSLWTIPVEISYYLYIPIFFWIQKKFKININALLLISILISLTLNQLYKLSNEMFISSNDSLYLKIFKYSLPPYLFYFLIGSLIYENWDKLKGHYINRGLIWLVIYLSYSILFSLIFGTYQISYWPNIWGLISIFLLSNTIISLAFTWPTISQKILKNNDLSYGIYLFHMLIINIVIQANIDVNNFTLLIVIIASVCVAYVTWKWIEKPALMLK